MILPNLRLSSRENQHWEFSGKDSIERCVDKKHFRSFPHAVTYNYNSRGFRDQEWPDSVQELRHAVWCIGDSFTVGLGSPLAHTWPAQLAAKADCRVINVSMDGASNQWISRKAQNILQELGPVDMVIMWSYTHRRERPDDNVSSDEDRRLHFDSTSLLDSKVANWQNFLDCKQTIDQMSAATVQFSIPDFHVISDKAHNIWKDIRGSNWPKTVPDTLEELNQLPLWILDEIKNLHCCFDILFVEIQANESYKHTMNLQHQHGVVSVEQKDFARDAYHFDLITAEWVAAQAVQRLTRLQKSSIFGT